MSFYSSLPPSFNSQVFSNNTNTSLSSFNFANTADSKFNGAFGIDQSGLGSGLTGENLLAPNTFPGTGSQQPAWTFITAPSEISWTIANAATRVDIFGTNNPPVVAGSRGMRDVSIRDALVEGFVRNVQVEAKIAALEQLLNYNLNGSDGFVSVPCYQFYANNKTYGGLKGYYIIKDVSVKEEMRDLTGNASRARIDINLMQVPDYQVNSGRDQASQVTAGGNVGTQTANQGVGTGKPAAGPGTPKTTTTTATNAKGVTTTTTRTVNSNGSVTTIVKDAKGNVISKKTVTKS
jgi:hypothetical protein